MIIFKKNKYQGLNIHYESIYPHIENGNGIGYCSVRGANESECMCAFPPTKWLFSVVAFSPFHILNTRRPYPFTHTHTAAMLSGKCKAPRSTLLRLDSVFLSLFLSLLCIKLNGNGWMLLRTCVYV